MRWRIVFAGGLLAFSVIGGAAAGSVPECDLTNERGDSVQAAMCYRELADRGDTWAQLDLGTMYENGDGVLQDYVLAHMWFNIAAAHEADAKVRDLDGKLRDELAAKMTPAQIAEAQRMAREWVPK